MRSGKWRRCANTAWMSLPGAAKASAKERERSQALNRYVTTPALVLVWVLGLTLAHQGGWFAAGWLHAKIALVVLLSALHGVVAARWRRGRVSGYGPLGAAAVLIAGIVVLAGTKPF